MEHWPRVLCCELGERGQVVNWARELLERGKKAGDPRTGAGTGMCVG